MIDGEKIRNRSHAIEELIRKSGVSINTAVILAGGNKLDIKIGGKTILEHQIEMLKKNGINNIIVAGAKTELAKCVEEKEPFGTAGAIKNLGLKERFLVLHVDTLMEPDINAVAGFHFQNNSIATLLLTTTDNPSKVGSVEMKGSVVTKFTEKPKGISSSLMNAGLYIMEPEIVEYISKVPSSLEKDVFPKLADRGLLAGYVFDGDVVDMRRA
jgi:NDP-sugar pyrophosphorylase family protein